MIAFGDDAIAGLQSAIGRRRVFRQRLDRSSRLRFAAAVDDPEPPLAHWAFFHDIAADAELGGDGHPRPGDFLPVAAGMPRRMFAATSIHFLAPLLPDEAAELVLEIVDVRPKRGSGGDLLFVDVDRVITQHGAPRIRELQTLVYRPMSAEALALPAVTAEGAAVPENGELWQPNATHLFRFSAATFNGHRIHYDVPYAAAVEGYPGLVVHGPFVAAKLAALAARRGPLATFQFRAAAPIFVNQPIRLVEIAPGAFQAIRCDDVVSVIAKATYS